jgi:hypothetical protein
LQPGFADVNCNSQTSYTDAYNRMTSRYTSVSHGRVAK